MSLPQTPLRIVRPEQDSLPGEAHGFQNRAPLTGPNTVTPPGLVPENRLTDRVTLPPVPHK